MKLKRAISDNQSSLMVKEDPLTSPILKISQIFDILQAFSSIHELIPSFSSVCVNAIFAKN